jgi:hypothetical protein
LRSGITRSLLSLCHIRRFAERLGWQPVVEAQHALYAQVLATLNGAIPGVER